MAFFPYLLVIVVFSVAKLWTPVKTFLAGQDVKIAWPGLDGKVLGAAGKPVTSTVYNFPWLSSPGSLLLICGFIVALVYRVPIGRAVGELAPPRSSCAGRSSPWPRCSALAYVMNMSGQTITIGTWIAGTGAAFAFLSPILGWLGTAVTGSDTSANALFATLQQTAAQQAGLDPTLLVAANTSGGVVGKMISPQNLTIAATAVGIVGRESDLFRKTVLWSVGLLVLLRRLQSTVVGCCPDAPGRRLSHCSTVRVALFVTCVNDTHVPGDREGPVELLERLGVDVEFPAGQTCCGQMHINTGYRAGGLPLVRRFVETFAGYDAVVAPSASCAARSCTTTADRGRARRPGAARRRSSGRAGRTYELTEFLVDVLGVTDVGRVLPAPGHLPPDLPLAARARAR